MAFFIWLAIKIWKCCGRRRHKNSGTKAGSYSKIDEDGQQGGDAWYGTSTTPAATDAPTAYGAGGTGHASTESKYEPMGYAGVGAFIAPSPLSSPDPTGLPYSASTASTTPSGFGAVASPPPYSGNTPAPISGNDGLYAPATSTGGEAQSYYASMGMSTAYARSISSTYEPSLMSSTSTPVPAYQAAYPPPVSPPPTQYPAYPAQATYVPHTLPGPRYGGS